MLADTVSRHHDRGHEPMRARMGPVVSGGRFSWRMHGTTAEITGFSRQVVLPHIDG